MYDVVLHSLQIIAADRRCDINVCDTKNRTALHHAVRVGAKDSLLSLLEKDAATDIPGMSTLCCCTADADGNTVLHELVLQKKPAEFARSVLDVLMSKGFRAEDINHDGHTLVTLVVTTRQTHLLDVLLKHSMNINIPNGTSGDYPLHIAVTNGDAEAVCL